MKFVIITPVRDEEQFLPVTIKCMLEQSVLPAEWIIVNDGSKDKTQDIIESAAENTAFIKSVSLDDRGFRKPGSGVVRAFYQGFVQIQNQDYDVVAKFDGDLEFPPNTLEEIAHAFEIDPKFGITGCTRYEKKGVDSAFRKVLVPKGFVGGPTKFYRRKCFEEIGGLIERAGWDGVDTIKANMKGWKTGELDSLKILHLKPTGTAKGEGMVKACQKYGDVSYYMGGYVWYFILRITGRSLEERNPQVGYCMLKGYRAAAKAKVRMETEEFRHFLKKTQRKNILFWFLLVMRNLLKVLHRDVGS